MKILVAGVGNIFLRDDGFGVAVARHLADADLPEQARVADFGIRGIHLAYELTGGGYDLTILVDATSRGGAPGTVYVLQPPPEPQRPAALVDAHALTPETVLALAGTFGGGAGQVLIVGCEPADTSPGMELTPPVADAVPRAADLVADLIDQHINTDHTPASTPTRSPAQQEERTC
ncbi:hydrogenase maturation protease [Planotetraspora phitsanulokensis]|uniref:Peptidase M52 n=1 Tax=Planotetraspora phitsanulokensis TaxID=575192 RepID=A0A8J3UB74_9ACTN|nr:hydrogenase maturation protease [Planotetraspora phitsanulokensis]GII41993.1 peptidase M52 [Planotetraspora phitsanulokensis]